MCYTLGGWKKCIVFFSKWSSTREISSQIEDWPKGSLFIGIVGRFFACYFLKCLKAPMLMFVNDNVNANDHVVPADFTVAVVVVVVFFFCCCCCCCCCLPLPPTYSGTWIHSTLVFHLRDGRGAVELMLQTFLGSSQRRCPIHPRCQCRSTGILQTWYAWWSLLGGDMNQNSLAVRLKSCSYLRLRQVMKCFRFTAGKPKESCWKRRVAYDLLFIHWSIDCWQGVDGFAKKSKSDCWKVSTARKTDIFVLKNDGWKSWKAILSLWNDPF